MDRHRITKVLFEFEEDVEVSNEEEPRAEIEKTREQVVKLPSKEMTKEKDAPPEVPKPGIFAGKEEKAETEVAKLSQ